MPVPRNTRQMVSQTELWLLLQLHSSDTSLATKGCLPRQAKRQEDDLRLKRNIEERRREKEEEARAREKIFNKLGASVHG